MFGYSGLLRLILMRSVVRFSAITIMAGVVIGLGIVGWLQTHPSAQPTDPPAAGSALSSNGSVLSVTSGDSNQLQGEPLTGQSIAGSSSNSQQSSSSTSSSSNQLPSPSQFGVYDQYKGNSTALYIDVIPGTGASVAKGSSVTIQFQLYLTTGQEVSASTPGKPFTFTEGAGTVIPGIEEAVFGMKTGGQRRLIIPPSTGFGSAGKSPIPPNAMIIMDVTLISFS